MSARPPPIVRLMPDLHQDIDRLVAELIPQATTQLVEAVNELEALCSDVATDNGYVASGYAKVGDCAATLLAFSMGHGTSAMMATLREQSNRSLDILKEWPHDGERFASELAARIDRFRPAVVDVDLLLHIRGLIYEVEDAMDKVDAEIQSTLEAPGGRTYILPRRDDRQLRSFDVPVMKVVAVPSAGGIEASNGALKKEAACQGRVLIAVEKLMHAVPGDSDNLKLRRKPLPTGSSPPSDPLVPAANLLSTAPPVSPSHPAAEDRDAEGDVVLSDVLPPDPVELGDFVAAFLLEMHPLDDQAYQARARSFLSILREENGRKPCPDVAFFDLYAHFASAASSRTATDFFFDYLEVSRAVRLEGLRSELESATMQVDLETQMCQRLSAEYGAGVLSARDFAAMMAKYRGSLVRCEAEVKDLTALLPRAELTAASAAKARSKRLPRSWATLALHRMPSDPEVDGPSTSGAPAGPPTSAVNTSATPSTRPSSTLKGKERAETLNTRDTGGEPADDDDDDDDDKRGASSDSDIEEILPPPTTRALAPPVPRNPPSKRNLSPELDIDMEESPKPINPPKKARSSRPAAGPSLALSAASSTALDILRDRGINLVLAEVEGVSEEHRSAIVFSATCDLCGRDCDRGVGLKCAACTTKRKVCATGGMNVFGEFRLKHLKTPAAQFNGRTITIVDDLNLEHTTQVTEAIKTFQHQGPIILAFHQGRLNLHLRALGLPEGPNSSGFRVDLRRAVEVDANTSHTPLSLRVTTRRAESKGAESKGAPAAGTRASTSRGRGDTRSSVRAEPQASATPTAAGPTAGSSKGTAAGLKARDVVLAANRAQANALVAQIWTMAKQLAQLRTDEEELTDLSYGEYRPSPPSAPLQEALDFAQLAALDPSADVAALRELLVLPDASE
ncbi:hypothetical protein L226DRAFT_522225 [Lentinus tigrinus ALCF2SS1-7]|uniref:uncharacterized protein n=1 Tax=Lentinus tigrinus ALCF2SS1-7 TaxID=1328758 RepID=UPI001165ED92|nr:hypothetical protein L226DRAFT_522225 [Lentinus tigrinus ALCF2SS1-7]